MSDLVETLLWLCRIPSPIGEERALADAVVARLGSVPLSSAIRRHGDSLVVPLVRGTGGPHVVLSGHLDVVRTEHDAPPRVEGDRLYGAGSADMKSGLCLMLDLAESVERPKVDVTLVFYAREEGPFIENELGPVLEAEPELRKASLAVMLEPSDNRLQLGCGGSLHATVSFQGRTAHSARPWQGDNAIHRAAGLLARLGALQPVSEIVDGLEWKSVVSATLASGGRAKNVIPDRFELNLNHRFGPQTSLGAARARIEALVEGDAPIRYVDESPSAPPHRDNPLVQALAESGVVAVEPKQAWTDVARFSALGVPAVNFGPGTNAQAHQKNEWTEIPKLAEGRAILARFFERIAGAGLALGLLVTLGTLAGCEQGAGARARRSDAIADAAPSGPTLFERSAVDHWVGAVRATLGPNARALSLDMRPHRATLQIEDPSAVGHVLEYAIDAQGISEPTSAELRGAGRLEENLFPLRAVALERIPDLVSEALSEIDPSDGRVERVLLRRQLPLSPEVRFRVYVGSPRLSGQVDFEGDGHPTSPP